MNNVVATRFPQETVDALDAAARRRLREVIDERLANDPRLGKRLSGVREALTDRPLWSYRSGDYRIVYAFSETELWILVVRVAAGYAPSGTNSRSVCAKSLPTQSSGRPESLATA